MENVWEKGVPHLEWVRFLCCQLSKSVRKPLAQRDQDLPQKVTSAFAFTLHAE